MKGHSKGEYQAAVAAIVEAVGGQAKVAEKIDVAPSLVSLVAKGHRKPSTDLLLRLGNVAAEKELYEYAVWFWQKAGVRVQSVVPAALKLLKDLDAPIAQGEFTSVPPCTLIDHPARHGRRLRVESALLPENSLSCSYLAISDDSLLPMFKRGDLVIVDEWQRDLWKMGSEHAALVHVGALAREGERGIKRVRVKGLRVGWLREIAGGMALDAPNPEGGINREIVAVAGADNPEFSVIGRVIGWIDMRGKTLAAPGKGKRK